MQLAARAVDLLPDMDHLALEVDVLPAQAEDFPAAHAAHAEEQQQDERGIQRVVAGGIEEGQCLSRCPRHDLGRFPARQLDQAGDVAGTQLCSRPSRPARTGSHAQSSVI
jgi:hypothetical protein